MKSNKKDMSFIVLAIKKTFFHIVLQYFQLRIIVDHIITKHQF